jgi:PadR family transcriptional regulator PadR
MAGPFLTLSSALILQAISNGYRYGFDVIAVTGLPGGTVYPALRRLEDAGFLTSTWEKESVAISEARPARKYYDVTRAGRNGLAEAAKRFPLIDRAQPMKPRAAAKPSRA